MRNKNLGFEDAFEDWFKEHIYNWLYLKPDQRPDKAIYSVMDKMEKEGKLKRLDLEKMIGQIQ